MKSALAWKSEGSPLGRLHVGDVAEQLQRPLGALGVGRAGDPDPAAPGALREPVDLGRRARRPRAGPRSPRRPRGRPRASRSAKRPCGIPSWVRVGDEAGDRSRVRWHPRSVAQGFAQVGGRPLGRVDVDVDAGAELEAGLDRQPRGDVDVPVEAARRRGGRCGPRGSARAGRRSARRAARIAVRIIAAPASSSSKRAAARRGITRSSKGEREAQGQISAASSSIATRRSLRRTSSTRMSLSRPPPAVRSP